MFYNGVQQADMVVTVDRRLREAGKPLFTLGEGQSARDFNPASTQSYMFNVAPADLHAGTQRVT